MTGSRQVFILSWLAVLVCAFTVIICGCGSSKENPSAKEAKQANKVKPMVNVAPIVKEILPESNPDSAVQPKLLKYLKPSQADAVQVIPPDQLDDFIRRGMNNDSVDHSTDEVIPPVKPGGRGMTEAEFKAFRKPVATNTPERIEVIPPSKPGGRGMTEAEFKTLRPEATIPQERSEVIPPGQSGGRGLTESEVNAPKPSQTSQKGGTATKAEVPSKARQ